MPRDYGTIVEITRFTITALRAAVGEGYLTSTSLGFNVENGGGRDACLFWLHLNDVFAGVYNRLLRQASRFGTLPHEHLSFSPLSRSGAPVVEGAFPL